VTAPAADTAAWQRVLSAQHAAIYGYGRLGVRLGDPDETSMARRLEAAHRVSRDSVAATLVALGQTPVAAATDYQPPQPVHDAASARRWALQLEHDCASAYRFLLAATATAAGQGTARRQAVAGLTGAATAATGWRALLTPAAPTVAFPGA